MLLFFVWNIRLNPVKSTWSSEYIKNDEIIVDIPTAEDIAPIMDRIVVSDKIITKMIEREE
jgi:hypothetical protein